MHIPLAIAACFLIFALVMGLADASSPGLRDASLKLTRALPASTTAVTSTAIDTGAATPQAYQPDGLEYLLSAPALSTAQLPDTKTMTYNIIGSANSDLSSPVTLATSILVQTGAGGAGAAANTARYRPPSNAPRYIGFTITPSASGTGDASGANATLEVLV
jgi:hypothetical protein